MSNTWLIIANSSQANLYNAHLSVNGGNLELLKIYNHPESRQKGSNLITDKSGHYYAGSFTSTKDPKEVETIRFAHELAHMLATSHAAQHYSDLVVVAPPHFLGLLKKALKSHPHKCVSTFVEKDYTHVPQHELATKVCEQLY